MVAWYALTPEEAMADRKRGGGSRSGAKRQPRRGQKKTPWQEANAPAADEPMSAAELDGQDLLGHSSVRGGAIAGVSDTDPERQADSLSYGTAGPAGLRRNPPEADDPISEGGISASGGAAGGAGGNAGRSTRGSVGAARHARQQPPSSESSSRLDLDHPGTDVGERRGGR
jgi:hypothetical protein